VIAHFCAFAILGALVRWPIGRGMRGNIGAWLVVAVFAALDEFHQSFTPGRVPDVGDWLVDVTGAALSIGFFGYYLDGGRLLGRAVPAVVPRLMLVALVAGAGFLAVKREAPSPRVALNATTSAFERAVPDRAERLAAGVVSKSVDGARWARAKARAYLHL
jgi:hypothetical protein